MLVSVLLRLLPAVGAARWVHSAFSRRIGRRAVVIAVFPWSADKNELLAALGEAPSPFTDALFKLMGT